MSNFKKYLEAAQDAQWPAVPQQEIEKPGLGGRIKNFILDKLGSIMGKKIIFYEIDHNDAITPLGEINYSVENVQILEMMINTNESIIFEGVWKALQAGEKQRPHMVVDVAKGNIIFDDISEQYEYEDGNNIVVEVKRNPRSMMFMPKDFPLKGE